MDSAKKAFDTFSDIIPAVSQRVSKEEVKTNIYSINA